MMLFFLELRFQTEIATHKKRMSNWANNNWHCDRYVIGYSWPVKMGFKCIYKVFLCLLNIVGIPGIFHPNDFYCNIITLSIKILCQNWNNWLELERKMQGYRNDLNSVFCWSNHFSFHFYCRYYFRICSQRTYQILRSSLLTPPLNSLAILIIVLNSSTYIEHRKTEWQFFVLKIEHNIRRNTSFHQISPTDTHWCVYEHGTE